VPGAATEGLLGGVTELGLLGSGAGPLEPLGVELVPDEALSWAVLELVVGFGATLFESTG
jgi:hypothetical protein